MKKQPKQYRQEMYDYIEELLGRPLSFEEHDIIRDMVVDYVFSTRNVRAILNRTFCIHDWKIDKKIEAGEKFRLYVKCSKCDKRTHKKMPTRSMRVQ